MGTVAYWIVKCCFFSGRRTNYQTTPTGSGTTPSGRQVYLCRISDTSLKLVRVCQTSEHVACICFAVFVNVLYINIVHVHVYVLYVDSVSNY